MPAHDPLTESDFMNASLRLANDKDLREKLTAYGSIHGLTAKSDVILAILRGALDKPDALATTLQEIVQDLADLRGEVREVKEELDQFEPEIVQPPAPELREKIDAMAGELEGLREDVRSMKKLRGEIARSVHAILCVDAKRFLKTDADGECILDDDGDYIVDDDMAWKIVRGIFPETS